MVPVGMYSPGGLLRHGGFRISSIGRAAGRQSGGCRFESCLRSRVHDDSRGRSEYSDSCWHAEHKDWNSGQRLGGHTYPGGGRKTWRVISESNSFRRPDRPERDRLTHGQHGTQRMARPAGPHPFDAAQMSGEHHTPLHRPGLNEGTPSRTETKRGLFGRATAVCKSPLRQGVQQRVWSSMKHGAAGRTRWRLPLQPRVSTPETDREKDKGNMATPTQDPFAQFLTGGLTAAKWPQIGFVVEGVVKSAALRQQTNYDTGALEFWNDGSPRMQLVVDLQSTPTGVTWKGLHNTQHPVPNDDGMRALYVKGNLQKAFTKALRDANASFEMGGHLRIERTQDVPNADPKKAPAHDYVVTWTSPSAEAAATDFLNTPEPATEPASIPTPAAPAQQAPANPFASHVASQPTPGQPPF